MIMEKQTAAQLIKIIAEAIKNDPAQFHFDLNISGMSISAKDNSTGMIVSATGGAPGSKTIGLNVSMNSNYNVEIVKKTANTALSQQVTQLYNTLNELAEKLENGDKSGIEKLYNSLKNTWVPGVITSVVGNVLSLALGISL